MEILFYTEHFDEYGYGIPAVAMNSTRKIIYNIVSNNSCIAGAGYMSQSY
jgi:hypothetical protein